MYESYLALIQGEENSENLTTLIDSAVDLEKISAFKSRTKPGDEASALVIDLGGSSLKLSFLKWRCSEPDAKPTFEIIMNKRLDFAAENRKDPLNQYSWNDWVSRKVGWFLDEIHKHAPTTLVPRTAALSFSFKIKQTALSSAEFVDCHKHWWFSRRGLRSKDIVSDLNASLRDANVDLSVNCVMNDVIATFMSGVALNMKNFMGLIIGTGTNAGYVINKNGRSVLVNSEWAGFGIDKLVEIDECSKKFTADEETGGSYYLLEILTAGMRMAEIIQERMRELKTFDETEISALTNMRIYEIFNKVSEDGRSGEISEFERTVCAVFKDFKRRAYMLLAPMILAIMKDHNEFSLITNGTIAGMEYDTQILREELLKAIETLLPSPKVLLGISYEANGSLVGAAFTSIAFADETANTESVGN